MVRTRLSYLAWSGVFVTLCAARAVANPPADDEAAVKAALAVQEAILKARAYLSSSDPGGAKKAVDLLEAQLSRANGNSAYLRLLREAYRGYIKDLRLANNTAAAKQYLERLCILEPSAAQDPSLRPPETTVTAEPKASPLGHLPAKLFPNWLSNVKKDPKLAPPKVEATIRAQVEDPGADNDPFAPTNVRPASASNEPNQQAQQLLTRAEEEFGRRRFAEARKLFEQAYQADKTCIDASRERWAYCMLNQVVDQLNQPGSDQRSLLDLQHQVRAALTLAPRLEETGKSILREIDQRVQTPSAPADVVAQTDVQHLGRNKEGWLVAETRHFRIFHNLVREQVEQVAAVAEKTRRDMYRKWFGTDQVEWSPKCELILHPTGADYSAMTGVSGNSPGHSRVERDASGQRVVGRRMDLRCDNPGMMETVLPHETTHIVLAGMFDHHHVPRWADEGMAVLTEPAFKVEQHRRNLDKSQQEHLLFGIQELMQLDNYPEPRRIAAFYAQSVCLVEFMAELRGPQVFTAFVRDGLRNGYGDALRKHYTMEMNELSQRWQQHLGETNRVAARP